MKNATFTMLLGLFGLIGFAQDSTTTNFNIKDFSLRDYVAPDIKYNRLMLGTDLSGSGGESGNAGFNNFNGIANMQLYTYRNLLNFQGSGYTSLELRFRGGKSKYENGKNTSTIPSLNLNHSSTNRWYNSNERFLGVHPNVNTQLFYSDLEYERDTSSTFTTRNNELVRGSVILSVGMGRIQPVTAARRAMDILISLQKYNRLSKKPSSTQIDSLAKIANTIAYKRFYDWRYKRIYQLEELDKGIDGMGLVDNQDMVYAANLSDIWNYGITYSRGSGSRLEFGAIPLVGYFHEKANLNNDIQEQYNSNYGLTGFASWIKQTPLNYQWQSDFSINLNYAIYGSLNQNYDPYKFEISEKGNSQLLGLRWTAGFFPNTRTSFQASPFVNLTASQVSETQASNKPVDNEFFGMAAGLEFQSYYYVSPRFRLGLQASTAFISDNYQDINPDARLVVRNGFGNQQINSNLSGSNIFQYNYRFTLSYAIF